MSTVEEKITKQDIFVNRILNPLLNNTCLKFNLNLYSKIVYA